MADRCEREGCAEATDELCFRPIRLPERCVGVTPMEERLETWLAEFKCFDLSDELRVVSALESLLLDRLLRFLRRMR